MRKYFRSLADVLASPIVAAVNALRRDKAARQDRVLQSTKLEDMIYQEMCIRDRLASVRSGL